MSLALSPGFLVNDPEHAPFGAAWLRGITPARAGVFAAVCFLVAFPIVRDHVLAGDYARALWHLWDRSARTFACAVPMFVLVIKVEAWTVDAPPRKRIAALTLAVVAGAMMYAALRTGLRFFQGNITNPALLWQVQGAYVSRALLTGGLLTAVLYFALRERYAARQLHRTRLAQVDLQRQLAESRLTLLRAQIEPHFLFNSLASVKRLFEKEPRQGRELLHKVADYLTVAAARARQPRVRLGDEIALARTFLGIFEVRMGKRLLVRVDVPGELEAALVPPLAIGTLVENAIKHGIGPRASGGAITLMAAREAGALVVRVHDDGVGFRARSGSGVGLANLRARLETLFGAEGMLELVANPAGGVTASLRIPLRMEASP